MFNRSKIISAIDIGSNSVLLTVARFNKFGRFKIIEECIEVPRLAEGLKKKGRIKKLPLKKCIRALRKFKRKCEKYKASSIICTGTAVFRKASNSQAVKKAIKKETGLNVRIISAGLEAKLSFISATEEIRLSDLKSTLVVDIGGGSTELVYSKKREVLQAGSVPIGALYLKDYFGIKYPLNTKKIVQIREYVNNIFVKAVKKRKFSAAIGVGGTITAIPTVISQIDAYSSSGIDFYELKKKSLERLITELSVKTFEELKKTKGMPPGRADILLPGLIILSELMKILKSSSITVRNRGLRFGVLFLHAKKLYINKRPQLTV